MTTKTAPPLPLEKLEKALQRFRSAIEDKRVTLRAVATATEIPLTSLERMVSSEVYIDRIRRQRDRVLSIDKALDTLLKPASDPPK
ncbi:MAG: hypothetical protein QNI84_13280 [Henriciella sp.]|nr:hypothetical protein [Henriciella sp.]